jgi:hypothetical protein
LCLEILRMASRKNYTVLIPFPKGGGHWAAVGEKLDLLGVEAGALVTAGRIELTQETKAKATKSEAK